MGIQQQQIKCKTCGKPTLHQRRTANHLAHFLITLFLLGLWLPIWIIAAISESPMRCQVCGRDAKAGSSFGGLVGMIVVVIILVSIAYAVIMPNL